MDNNFEKLLLVPKADSREVCIKFMLCITPCLNFTKKRLLLNNMSKYELWLLHEFSHNKSVKKTISLRPFMQVTKVFVSMN